MPDRFALSREDSIPLAERLMPESIYSGMRMENRNVTFPETQTILDGINVAGVGLGDIQAILNLRDAWRLVLDTLDEPLDIDYLCRLQERVAYREALAWGELRDGLVGISGVDYVPPVPSHPEVALELAALLQDGDSATGRALAVFCWASRRQLFWDGNKRTAMLAANKLMLQAGAGLLLVADRDMLEFSQLLSAFYQSGQAQELMGFLYDKAVVGISGRPGALGG